MRVAQDGLRRLIDVLDLIVDEHVGIIGHLDFVPRQSGDPDFFQFGARACNTGAFSRERNFYNTGGASSDREQAAAKAIGEAVERYCGALFDVEEFPLSSFEAASFPCVLPQEFALYSPEQYEQPGFPWVPFDESTPVRWAPAIAPSTGETVYVPAAMVFVPYFYYQGTGDSPIVQPISTGLSCHLSPAEAAVHAVCEVIERDAVTITWQARLSHPQVRVETLSEENQDLVRRFERTGDSVTLLDITLDAGVPICLAVLCGGLPERAALVVAGAADVDSERAVRKSLEELEHTRRYSQRMKSYWPRLVPEADYSNVKDQSSHLNFWCDPANVRHADFLVASQHRVNFGDLCCPATGNPLRDLRMLAEKVRATGHRILLVDLTTPDVSELGLAVVRAIIPGYHPLYMGYRTRATGGRRLWETPQKLGYLGISRKTGDNPFPHPYP
jgi:ribosomal protein S12 methylthiotransferase accessory factor